MAKIYKESTMKIVKDAYKYADEMRAKVMPSLSEVTKGCYHNIVMSFLGHCLPINECKEKIEAINDIRILRIYPEGSFELSFIVAGNNREKAIAIVQEVIDLALKPQYLMEVINFGGCAATRAEVYAHSLEACKRPGATPQEVKQAAALFAFGPRTKALSPDEAVQLIPFAAIHK